MPKKTPSYRQRKGYDQAIVTLTDARTKKRRDYWLGNFGSHESRQRYHRLLAEWEANARVLPDAFEDRPITKLHNRLPSRLFISRFQGSYVDFQGLQSFFERAQRFDLSFNGIQKRLLLDNKPVVPFFYGYSLEMPIALRINHPAPSFIMYL